MFYCCPLMFFASNEARTYMRPLFLSTEIEDLLLFFCIFRWMLNDKSGYHAVVRLKDTKIAQAGEQDAEGEYRLNQPGRNKTLCSCTAIHADKTAKPKKKSKAPVGSNSHVWEKWGHSLEKEDPGNRGDQGSHQGCAGNRINRKA